MTFEVVCINQISKIIQQMIKQALTSNMWLAQGNILLCGLFSWTTTMSMLFPIESLYPLNNITIFSLNGKKKKKRWKPKTNKVK